LERVAVIFKVEMVDRTAVARDARHPFVLGPFRLDDDSLSMVGRIARPPVDRGRNDETGCKCEIAKKRPVAGLKRKRKRPASLGRSRFRFEGNPKAHLRKPGSGRGPEDLSFKPLGEIPDVDAHDAEIRVSERGVLKDDVPQHRQEQGGQEADEQPVDKGPQNGAAASAGGVAEHSGRRSGEEMGNRPGDDQRGYITEKPPVIYIILPVSMRQNCINQKKTAPTGPVCAKPRRRTGLYGFKPQSTPRRDAALYQSPSPHRPDPDATREERAGETRAPPRRRPVRPPDTAGSPPPRRRTV
jgi:hypothetical protein